MPVKLMGSLILLLPLAEIAGFVIVGHYLGVLGTIEAVLASSFLGILLLRQAGFATIAELGRVANRRQMPLPILIEGAFRVIAAILFIIPGFVTDFLGLLLLVPFFRHSLIRWLARGIDPRPQARTESGVIEGEFHEITPADFLQRDRPPLPPTDQD